MPESLALRGPCVWHPGTLAKAEIRRGWQHGLRISASPLTSCCGLGRITLPSLSLHFLFCKMGRICLSIREVVRMKLNGNYSSSLQILEGWEKGKVYPQGCSASGLASQDDNRWSQLVCGPDRGHKQGFLHSPLPPARVHTHSPDGGCLAGLLLFGI